MGPAELLELAPGYHLPGEGSGWREGSCGFSHLLLSLLQVWARAVYSYVLQTTLSQVSVPPGCCCGVWF